MPVYIDQIDTEIELVPGSPRPVATGPAPAPAGPSVAPNPEASRRTLLATLEAELEHYMRMRG